MTEYPFQNSPPEFPSSEPQPEINPSEAPEIEPTKSPEISPPETQPIEPSKEELK